MRLVSSCFGLARHARHKCRAAKPIARGLQRLRGAVMHGSYPTSVAGGGICVKLLSIALAAFLLSVAPGKHALGLEPRRMGQEAMLSQAIFADGRLWMLSDAGVLSSVAEGESQRSEIILPEPVRKLWVHDGHPAILSCDPTECREWTIRIWQNGDWKIKTKIPVQGEQVLDVVSHGPEMTVLTSKRIMDVVGDGWKSVDLSVPLHAAGVTAIVSDSIFLGFNAGEWGGGLKRIDRASGEISNVEKNTSGELCGGPLNTQCDPVNAVAAHPWKENCAIAAVGLVHMGHPSGRIVEICGSEVQVLYSKPYFRANSSMPTGGISGEVAFYGLARRGDALVAAGMDGLYFIERSGDARIATPPPFKEFNGVYVSFDLPDVVLVLTNINQRRAVTGAAPMLVPRL